MTKQHRVIPAFDDSLPQLRTTLGGDELQLARIGHAPNQGILGLTSAADDAFALVVQLKSLPAHSLWHDGWKVEVAAGPAHTVTVLDLAADAAARIEQEFDSLNFRVPRAALDYFTDQAGSQRVSRLHLPGRPFSCVDPVIGGLTQTLVDAMTTGRETPLFADHLLLSLMAHVTARYGEGRTAVARTSGGLSSWQERRAKAMLDPADGPTPTLSAVAEACGVSVAHFSRAFKTTVGLAPWAWHQARRVEHAQILLRDVSLPLAQVAAIAGFADQSHFTRAFRNQTGSSPGQWRRERGRPVRDRSPR